MGAEASRKQARQVLPSSRPKCLPDAWDMAPSSCVEGMPTRQKSDTDRVDTDEADEVIDVIAKTVAELTSQQDGVRKIVHCDVSSRLWREALTAIRIEWSTGPF
jgi:hypothetical protein